MALKLLKIRNRSSGCKCGRGNLKYYVIEIVDGAVIKASPAFRNLHRLAKEWGTWTGCVLPTDTAIIEHLVRNGQIKRNQVIVE